MTAKKKFNYVFHKMNKKIKKLWVNALDSGEFEQGSRRLLLKNKYCCLGVLCEVYCRDKGLDLKKFLKETDETVVLPHVVREWAELGSCNPTLIVTAGGVEYSAAEANDGVPGCPRQSFPEIAKLIKKKF